MASIELGTYLRGKSAQYHECIEACVACLVACEMCSDACLDESDIGMMRSCIRLAGIARTRASRRSGR